MGSPDLLLTHNRNSATFPAESIQWFSKLMQASEPGTGYARACQFHATEQCGWGSMFFSFWIHLASEMFHWWSANAHFDRSRPGIGVGHFPIPWSRSEFILFPFLDSALMFALSLPLAPLLVSTSDNSWLSLFPMQCFDQILHLRFDTLGFRFPHGDCTTSDPLVYQNTRACYNLNLGSSPTREMKSDQTLAGFNRKSADLAENCSKQENVL